MINFDDLISNFLRREPRQKEIGRYYPSECGSCLRKVWYSYKHPKELDIETIKVFQMGNLVHDFVSDVMKSEKNPQVDLIGAEIPFKLEIDGMIISGRVDNIITLNIDNRKYLVEVKSTKSMEYLSKPDDSYVLQLQLYMYHKGIHHGIILYIEKNTLKTKIFEIDYNLNVAEEAINRFRALHQHLSNDKLIQPEARIDRTMNWMCKFCHYRDQCYKDTPSNDDIP
tara:strand:- start:49889 stop:50566 length:678 start_codon:yes stop_codon:yes gene_type:complete